MILKINNYDTGWLFLDGIDWIQSQAEPREVKNREDLDELFEDNNYPLINYSDEDFPFKVGILYFRQRGKTDVLCVSWRGKLYIMNNEGKTVESCYVPY